MAKDDGGPAFPGKRFLRQGEPASYRYEEGYVPTEGMVLRDWLAGTMASGLLGSWGGRLTSEIASLIAGEAYMMADAMLKARKS